MNDSTKPTPGRPRVYSSNSEKLGAFRSRLESAGYLRKEVLVTRSTADAVAVLAKAHGVNVTDAASALLEYGLEKFNETHMAPPAVVQPLRTAASQGAFEAGTSARSRGMVASSSVPLESASFAMSASAAAEPSSAGLVQGASASGRNSADDESNPILRFFATRKQESQK